MFSSESLSGSQSMFLLTAVVPVIIYVVGTWLGVVVRPYPDRLAVIPEDSAQIDNKFYDNVSWWTNDTAVIALLRMNEIRVPYFLREMQAEGVSSGDNVLDVGCGGGYVSLALAESGDYHVTGLDMSSSSIAEATMMAREKQLSHRVEFVQGSLYELPFGDGEFDAVVISDVLEHLLDLRRAVNEIHRVLRPGGVLVFDTIARTPYSYLFLWFGPQKLFNVLPKDAHDWRMFIQPSEMEALLQESGFDISKSQIRPWKGIHINLSLWPSSLLLSFLQKSLGPLITDVVEIESLVGSYAGWAYRIPS